MRRAYKDIDDDDNEEDDDDDVSLEEEEEYVHANNNNNEYQMDETDNLNDDINLYDDLERIRSRSSSGNAKDIGPYDSHLKWRKYGHGSKQKGMFVYELSPFEKRNRINNNINNSNNNSNSNAEDYGAIMTLRSTYNGESKSRSVNDMHVFSPSSATIPLFSKNKSPITAATSIMKKKGNRYKGGSITNDQGGSTNTMNVGDKADMDIEYKAAVLSIYMMSILATSGLFVGLFVFPSFVDRQYRVVLTGISFLIAASAIPWLGVNSICSHEEAPVVTNGEKILATINAFSTLTASACGYLSLNLLGLTDIGGFYLSIGEPYFSSVYGILSLTYDAMIHLPLHILCGYCVLTGITYKYIGLFVGGSMFNSIFPLLVGAAGAGKHTDKFRPSTLLFLPWCFLPFYIIVFCLKAARKDRVNSNNTSNSSNTNQTVQKYIAKKQNSQQKHVHVETHFLVDISFFLFYLGSLIVHILRVLAVIGSTAPPVKVYVEYFEPLLSLDQDPTTKGVVLIQSLQTFFYFVPIQFFLMFEILYRGYTGNRTDELLFNFTPKNEDNYLDSLATNLISFYAGAALQAQSCIMFGLGIFEYRKSSLPVLVKDFSSHPGFLHLNILLLIVPLLHLFYYLVIDNKMLTSSGLMFVTKRQGW